MFTDSDPICELNLSYYSKNSLFARVFDLVAETGFSAVRHGEYGIAGDLNVGIRYSGGLKIRDAAFDARSSGAETLDLVSRLNDVGLVRERILSLEATDVRINYDSVRQHWKIGMATGKGSAVWSLLPPVLMLIQFTETDAIKMLELFRLLVHTIKQFERRLPEPAPLGRDVPGGLPSDAGA
jgi:hypothetical protein